jgi:hypothetical protein
MRLDDRELAYALESAGFRDVHVELEVLEDEWTVNDRTIDVRLDAIGAAGEASLRERWQREFGTDELDRLLDRLKSLRGQTVTFRLPQAWVTARRS